MGGRGAFALARKNVERRMKAEAVVHLCVPASKRPEPDSKAFRAMKTQRPAPHKTSSRLRGDNAFRLNLPDCGSMSDVGEHEESESTRKECASRDALERDQRSVRHKA